MSDARSTYRYAVLLLGGSVLVVGALIANGMESATQAASADDTAIAEAAVPPPEGTSFAKWADESEMADGKGRLIGEIERDGKIIELRQMPEGMEPPQADKDLLPDDALPEQGVSGS